METETYIHTRRNNLGETIRDLRIAQSLSQRKLALMAGSDQSYIWRLENGKVNISFDTLCRIADALDVEVGSLFTF